MMKRCKFLLIAFGMMAFVATGCGGNGNGGSDASASSEEVASSAAEESNQVTYHNEQIGFSVTLPEGFTQQNNDAQMEAERGGKLFLNAGCMIDVTGGKQNPNFSIEDDYKYLVDFAYKEDGSELISQELADDHYLVKGKDEYGLRAQYKAVKNGKEIDFMLTYPTDKQAELDRDIDAMIKSLKID